MNKNAQQRPNINKKKQASGPFILSYEETLD